MLKLTGSLSESFHPTECERTGPDAFATNPIARRIGRTGRLFKKTAPKMATSLPFAVTCAAGQALRSPRPSLENDESNSKLSISNWNLMVSKSLDALREGCMAELQQPASLLARDQHLSDLPAADFWRDLPDVELPGGPVSVKPFAFARRSVHADRADEPEVSLH